MNMHIFSSFIKSKIQNYTFNKEGIHKYKYPLQISLLNYF